MSTPLADRLRPQTLEDIVGQQHLLSKGKALRNIIESGTLPNLIFYGPSGVGKTTLARIIAQSTNRTLRKLNGTNASIKDIKDIVEEIGTFSAQNGILLYLDEIQYFNKKQQQSLLEYIENGKITLIASTTENPYFYIYSAILSRSTVFEFKPVGEEDIEKAVIRGFEALKSECEDEIKVQDGVTKKIASNCCGDVRKALNAVELCYLASLPVDGKRIITLETAVELTQGSSLKYDKDGDNHYDLLSAFQKSMRGSDPDAAIYYLARLLEAGDILSAARRLLVCACEDVGLAYPMIIPIVKSAVDCALQVGMPEARIPLADAVILVCNSPKSNSAYLALDKALMDVKSGKSYAIPRHLQNMHYDGEDNKNKGQFYDYPHDFKNHWTPQQYLPDEIRNVKYYNYGENRNEQAAKDYWNKIKNEQR